MKTIVFGLHWLLVCGFGYEEVNKIVGDVIDKNEAAYYRIFEDIPGFETARFFFSGESIGVEVNTINRGNHEAEYRYIDPATFISLGKYIEFFREVIDNPEFRREFVRTYPVGWPMVSKNSIEEVKTRFKIDNCMNTSYCVSNATCATANFGSYLGLGIDHYSDIEVGSECGTSTITVPVYKVDRTPFCLSTSVGIISSLAYSSVFFRTSNANLNEKLLTKDIVAFDRAGVPITERELNKEMNRYSLFGYNSTRIESGIFLALLAAAGTTTALFLLNQPQDEYYLWNSEMDYFSSTLPIIGLGVSEFIALSMIIYKKNVKKARQAAIQRLTSRLQPKPQIEEP